ncbi:MAG: 50S ribosomal protein L29 [Pirellulaceae bacterium]
MKTSEVREMSDEQLQLTLQEACERLFRLRIQSQTERLDAPSELRHHRKLIARIKTVQQERSSDRDSVVQGDQGRARMNRASRPKKQRS